MIKQIRVQRFKAIEDATLDLTPFHLLIGPNDSGKTSFLEAIAALSRSLDHPIAKAFLGRWDGQQLVHGRSEMRSVHLSAMIKEDSLRNYTLTCEFPTQGKQIRLSSASLDGQSISSAYNYTLSVGPEGDNQRSSGYDEAVRLQRLLCPVWYMRWSARTLALPATLDPDRNFRLEGNGFGLPTLIDDLLSSNRQRFDQMKKRFQESFPNVVSIRLRQEAAFKNLIDDPEETLSLKPGNGKQIYFILSDDTAIPASQAAEGMLYTLAYLAIASLPNPPKILLVEEPENGIHPARVREIVSLLRQLTEGSSPIQIIMTSHSPYLVDEMQPDEVTWCHRRHGQIVTQRLDQNQVVEKQKDLFELGEIWSNYLDIPEDTATP